MHLILQDASIEISGIIYWIKWQDQQKTIKRSKETNKQEHSSLNIQIPFELYLNNQVL